MYIIFDIKYSKMCYILSEDAHYVALMFEYKNNSGKVKVVVESCVPKHCPKYLHKQL